MPDAEPFAEPHSPAPTPAVNPPIEPKAAEPGHNGEDSSALARPKDESGLHSSPDEPSESNKTPDKLEAASDASDYSPQLMDTSAPAPPVAAPAPPPSHAVDNALLEERIRRLEATIVRLTEQRASTPSPPPQPVPTIPVATATPASTGIWSDATRRAVTPTAPGYQPAVARPAWPSFRSSMLWLLWDTWAEARAIVRMFVDPRYHFPWSVRLLMLTLVAAILTSKYWVPGSSIPILGDWLLVKLVDFLLAFILFKWLGHEARRYRQTSPDLPPNLRL